MFKKFSFFLLFAIIPALGLCLNPTGDDRVFSGYFKYKTANRSVQIGMNVKLVDELGNIVLETKTDQQGYFEFKELPLDGNYLVQIDNAEDIELTLLDSKKAPLGAYVADERNIFSYRKLSASRTGIQNLIDESNIDFELNIASLDGQFVYKKLTMDQGAGVLMQLLDESGNVFMSTKTKEKGYFKFEDLPLDKNYYLKIAESVGEGIVKIYNSEGAVRTQLAAAEDGNFSYHKIEREECFNLDLMKEKDVEMVLNTDLKHVMGQFSFGEKDQAMDAKMRVLAVDGYGKTIMSATVDTKGYFYFTELPPAENYLFSIETDDPQASLPPNLDIFDKAGNVTEKLKSKGGKYFKFLVLKKDSAELNQMEDTDVAMLGLNFASLAAKESANKPTIYFSYNSSTIDPNSAKVLRSVLSELQDDKALKVQVFSHTDSRGSSEHNEKLSQRRYDGIVSYLVARGIDRSRISGQAFGEGQLVNGCDDASDCPEEMHQKNRRAEFQLY